MRTPFEAGARRRLTWSTALLLAAGALSCSGGEPGRGAGGTAGFTLGDTFPTQFRAAGESHALSRVDGAVPDGAGGLWVIQGQDGHIKRLGSDGTLRQIVGRSGDGPGEFRSIAAIGRTDTGGLWAFDQLSRLIHLFSAEGELETTRRIPLQEGLPQGMFSPLAVWSDLSILGHSGRFFDGNTAPPITYHFLDAQGMRSAPLMTVDPYDLVAIYRVPQGAAVLLLPVSAGPVIFPSPHSPGWVSVHGDPGRDPSSDSLLLTLTSGTPGGPDGGSFDVRVHRPRVDESVVDGAVREIASSAASAGLVPSVAQAEQELRSILPQVERWPAAQEAVPSNDGFLWLRTGLTDDGRPLYERLGLAGDGPVRAHPVEGLANVRLLWVERGSGWGLLERETGEEVIVRLGLPSLPSERPFFGPGAS